MQVIHLTAKIKAKSNLKNMILKNKAAIITSVSKGTGLATLKALIEKNADLSLLKTNRVHLHGISTFILR